jgi:hypothetical protein
VESTCTAAAVPAEDAAPALLLPPAPPAAPVTSQGDMLCVDGERVINACAGGLGPLTGDTPLHAVARTAVSVTALYRYCRNRWVMRMVGKVAYEMPWRSSAGGRAASKHSPVHAASVPAPVLVLLLVPPPPFLLGVESTCRCCFAALALALAVGEAGTISIGAGTDARTAPLRGLLLLLLLLMP